MKKIVLCLFVAVFTLAGCGEDPCRVFLNDLGYETEREPVESAAVKIPEDFGDVYENYNELQKEAGFDLVPYKGKDCTRLTYQIKNHPLSDGVRANIILCEGVIIGGDISTVAIDGFMLPLEEFNQ